MHVVRVGIGRPIQFAGIALFLLSTIGTWLWTLFVLFSVFGALALLVVWFSTGTFPVDVLLLWLSSLIGIILVGVGAAISGDD
jgi:hypothetical protein